MVSWRQSHTGGVITNTSYGLPAGSSTIRRELRLTPGQGVCAAQHRPGLGTVRLTLVWISRITTAYFLKWPCHLPQWWWAVGETPLREKFAWDNIHHRWPVFVPSCLDNRKDVQENCILQTSWPRSQAFSFNFLLSSLATDHIQISLEDKGLGLLKCVHCRDHGVNALIICHFTSWTCFFTCDGASHYTLLGETNTDTQVNW